MSFYYHILQSKSFITGGMEILSMLKDLKGKSVNLGIWLSKVRINFRTSKARKRVYWNRLQS